MALHPFVEKWDVGLRGDNPLGFPGYDAPENESVRTGRTEHYALIEGRFDVMGGSMGAAHGERVVRAFRRAQDQRLPVVVVTTSGGARLQEGMVALVQMARTSAAAVAHAHAGLMQVALIRSPTTGGVYASYGSLGDVRAASPGALIGFAGPRIVHETLNVDVNTESHSAESAFKAGLIDAIVSEIDQPRWVEGVLGLRNLPPDVADPFPRPLREVDIDLTTTDPWEAVQHVRAETRPSGWQWAAALCESWVELKGLDPVLRAGVATVAGKRMIMIASDRHIGAGRPSPKAYQLARRALKMADRLHLPFVSLVDTPGAEPGPEAERGGIAFEIAKTFVAQASLRVPSVALCVGEGGSGGALVAACDRLLLLPDAIFSVIAPEGAAVILGRDPHRAAEFAGLLKLTAPELLALDAIDGIVKGGVEDIRAQLLRALAEAQPGDRARRHDRLTMRWLR